MSSCHAVLVTAAGSSRRFNESCDSASQLKKEFLTIGGQQILSMSIRPFLQVPGTGVLAVTYRDGDLDAVKGIVDGLSDLTDDVEVLFVKGGLTRQESVFNGLKKLADISKNQPEIVLVHDGARPWVTENIIQDVIKKATIYGASVPAIPAVDTQKIVDESGKITHHLKRKYVYAVQTPQAFEFNRLLEAHTKACNDNTEYTDDTEIWAAYCGDVYISEGNIINKKITFQSDL